MAAGEQLTRPLRRAAVIGRPVARSLSPRLHTAAYAHLGLTGWRYDAVDLDPAQVGPFLADLDPGWAGLSVTMPHKRAVAEAVDTLDEDAAALRVANTVVVRPRADGSVHLHGANTDVHGIAAALAAAGARPRRERPGVVLGAGATAASAVAGLRRLGCTEVVLVVRDAARAQDTREAALRLGVGVRLLGWSDAHEALRDADVVVSTVPAGAADDLRHAVPSSVAGVLLDVVYDPWPTPLAAAWSAAGGTVVPGAEMLLRQAGEQVHLLTGRPAPLEVMRAAVGPPIG